MVTTSNGCLHNTEYMCTRDSAQMIKKHIMDRQLDDWSCRIIIRLNPLLIIENVITYKPICCWRRYTPILLGSLVTGVFCYNKWVYEVDYNIKQRKLFDVGIFYELVIKSHRGYGVYGPCLSCYVEKTCRLRLYIRTVIFPGCRAWWMLVPIKAR